MKEPMLERIKGKLLLRRQELLEEVDNISSHSLSRTDEMAGDLSTMPIHMADIGSDNFEKEFALDIIEGEKEELRQIDEALARLADGCFGVCTVCGKGIPWQRLAALPFARHCIECQREEESTGE